MNQQDIDWIIQIKSKASALRQRSEDFQRDVSSSPFDIDDARAYFEAIKETVEQLEQLLDS